ncbi:MAG: liaF [Paenibacillus sp.]|jgi:predicted membrane protein|nr:liaF [Paenibacillus sp.]
MAKRLLFNPITVFVIGFAVIYFAALRTGFSEWLDPLFGVGTGVLLYRYVFRWMAVIPWAYAVIQLLLSFQVGMTWSYWAVFIMSCGYLLLLDPVRPLSQQHLKAPFGDIHIRPSELQSMHISKGIGDVRLDLSNVIAVSGEHRVTIHRLVGSIAIFIPYDLEVKVEGKVYAGRTALLSQTYTGFPHLLRLETEGYENSGSRLRIQVKTFIGDVSVVYI